MLFEDDGTHTDAARLADQIVAAFARGDSYIPALAELCARCEATRLDHKTLLDDAMHRAGIVAELRSADPAM